VNIDFEISFTAKLKKLKKRQPSLCRKIYKVMEVFRVDQKNSSLKLHKLRGKFGDYWSISIEENYRLIFYYSSDAAVFVDMGTPDQVYKK